MVAPHSVVLKYPRIPPKFEPEEHPQASQNLIPALARVRLSSRVFVP